MSEGRSRTGLIAGIALVVALAAGGAAGYVFHRQNTGLGVVIQQVKQIRGELKGVSAARKSMERVRLETGKTIAEGMSGLWRAVRSLKTDIDKLDSRLAKLEGGGGGGVIDTLRKQVKEMRGRAVLLQARVEALERLQGARGKTVFVPGANDDGGRNPASGGGGGDSGSGSGGSGGGTKSVAAAGGAKKRGDGQPPFWNGCIDSLNKSARLANSAENVCDCIIGRLKSSSGVTAKDRELIFKQTQFSTRVRGVSKGAQTVLEQAVVQCALRQFKDKK